MAGLGAWLRGLSEKRVEPRAGPRPREGWTGRALAFAHARRSAREQASFGAASNEFAFALFHQLRQQPGNLIFSPFSVRAVLAMAQAGARGRTASQMADVLALPPADEEPAVSFKECVESLVLDSGPSELVVANSLWVHDRVRLLPEYLDVVGAQHCGESHALDFQHGPDAACARINRWVEDRTSGRIRDLIPPASLTANTRLVLANAVHFQGRWAAPFGEQATSNESFHLDDGGTTSARLMRQHGHVPYLAGDGYQAVDLAFNGDGLSMLVILPDRKDGLPDIESRLSRSFVDECVGRLASRDVVLVLPRFKFAPDAIGLTGPLVTLGMASPFQPAGADFSGINGYAFPHEDALFISTILHKASVEVDEQGAEAAAAAALIMMATSALHRPEPDQVFLADHPFLVAIRHRRSGAVLFLGRVADPTLKH